MRPRAHVGSLGIGGISADVRSTPSVIARRYHLHVLLLAAFLRPFIVLWDALKSDGA